MFQAVSMHMRCVVGLVLASLIAVLIGAQRSDACWQVLGEMRRRRGVPAETAYRVLRERLQSRSEFIGRHLIEQSEILEVLGPLDQLKADYEGAGSFAVLRVRTTGGEMALKLYSTQPEESLNVSGGWQEMRAVDESIIQAVAAEHGFGLPIAGTVDRTQINQLLGRFPQIWGMQYQRHAGGDHPEWGVLMPLIEEPYNPKMRMLSHSVNKLPQHATSWDWVALREWFRDVQEYLNGLEARAYDFQILIDRSGHPYLMDTPYLVFDVANPSLGRNRYSTESYNGIILSRFNLMVHQFEMQFGRPPL